MKKRIFTLLLALLMVCALTPVSVFAEDTTAACTHQHDESCGYRAPVEEVPCDMGCTETDENGITIHAEGCAYQPGTEGAECTHVHDETCGGLPAQEPDPVCTCTDKCAEGAVNTECAVCGAEGADLSACVGTPKEPEAAQPAIPQAVTDIQARIDALPTADAYRVMTAEEQDAAYATAAALSDDYNALPEDQQAMVDTSRMLALFEAMNESRDTYETPNVTITYTDGTTEGWDGSSRLIITRDCSITVNRSFTMGGYLQISEYVAATIDGGGYTITSTQTEHNVILYDTGSTGTIRNLTIIRDVSNEWPLLAVRGILDLYNTNLSEYISNTIVVNGDNAYLTIYSGHYISKTTGNPTIACKSGTVRIKDGTFEDLNQVILFYKGTLYIEGGQFTQTAAVNMFFIQGDTVYMTGGTLTGYGPSVGCGIIGTQVSLTGGTITNFAIGVGVTNFATSFTIGGNMTFSNNTTDIYMANEKAFTLLEDFANTASVQVYEAIPANTKRIITTDAVSAGKLAQITSAKSEYEVGYDEETQLLFLYKHEHDWLYTAGGNTVTAACTITSVPPCGLQPVLVLDAPDMAYNGEPYSLASVINGITATTGAEAGSITYWSGDTQLDTAPTEIGTYTAKITIGGETAEDTFEIFQGHTVTYIVDGEVIDTQIVKHGGDAAAPTIPAKTGYGQTPPSWDKDGKNITKDTVITAVYTINQYTVTYVADGKTVAVETVKHGQDSTAPKIPEKSGYTAQWDGDGKCITGDTTITALYTAITVTPHTGDDMPLAFWAAAMLLSLLGIGTVITTRKRCR